MKSVPFSKFFPGGNPTILITGPVETSVISDISTRIMSPAHIFAEQVGVIRLGDISHLQMMGGEFCVNATRCAAFWLVKQNALLWNGTFWQGEITVSGAAGTIELAVSDDADVLHAAIDDISRDAEHAVSKKHGAGKPAPNGYEIPALLYCAARMPCSANSVVLNAVEPGAVLVALPGISHLLLNKNVHNMPADWQKSSKLWRKKTNLADLPASGVIWHETSPSGLKIYPAVYVKDTDCEHMETACGSASLALALAIKNADRLMMDSPLATDNAVKRSLSIMQPSGEALTILFETSQSSDCLESGGKDCLYLPQAAWVSGPVRLVADGIAYL